MFYADNCIRRLLEHSQYFGVSALFCTDSSSSLIYISKGIALEAKILGTGNEEIMPFRAAKAGRVANPATYEEASGISVTFSSRGASCLLGFSCGTAMALDSKEVSGEATLISGATALKLETI